MKKLFTLLTLAVFSFGLVAFDAEAKRFGGGKSVGKQREAISPQAAPKSGQAPAAARHRQPLVEANGWDHWLVWPLEDYWRRYSWAAHSRALT